MRTLKARSIAALAVLLSGATAAHAQEVRVMTSRGMAAPYLDLIPAIERATEQKIITVVTSTGLGEESIPQSPAPRRSSRCRDAARCSFERVDQGRPRRFQQPRYRSPDLGSAWQCALTLKSP